MARPNKNIKTMNLIPKFVATAALISVCSCAPTEQEPNQTKAFPYTVTDQTPNRKDLSEAANRAFTEYMAYRAEDNPLFTNFKYTRLKGLEYPDDGTLTRRDPSKVVRANGKYYMWYTRRHTKYAPIGANKAAEATDEIPSTDWDLCDIWYATSLDGFTWEEQGCAVARPAAPEAGFRSISTPDILVWKGKYYLYYQAFSEPSGLKGDYCPVSMAWADSPDGPWHYHKGEVITRGAEGEWNQFAIHDPYPLVHNGQIYIYYKSAFNRPDRLWVGQGLAIGDDPAGPFTHHPNNPLLTSGHETSGFPYKGGLAMLQTTDGQERNTIQYAEDWVNFRIASIVDLPPTAAAPYCKDAFTNTTNGEGIEWGVCHFTGVGKGKARHSEIARFDCSLTQEADDHSFQNTRLYLKDEFYYTRSLPAAVKKKRMQEAKEE